MTTRTILLAAALAALQGCSGCANVPPEAVQDCQTGSVVPDVVATDILFVVDDSLSMAEEQQNLRDNLVAFVQAMAASPVANEFRVGVTSTSVEDFGATDTTGHAYPGGVPYPAGALVAIRQVSGVGQPGQLIYDPAAYPGTGGWGGPRQLEKSDPDLLQNFQANVQLGTAGTGKEQHLRAARLALSERLLDTNQGFLRPGARLAVIFVSDEDDCSDTVAPFAASNNACHAEANKDPATTVLDPVGEFAAFLLGPVDGEVRDVVVGAISGFSQTDLAPSCGESQCPDQTCSTAFNKADRFQQLIGQVGGARMVVGSICDASFADSLIRFAEVLMPSTLPLQGAPADWRMLAVKVTRASGAVDACAVALEGTAAQPAADAIYSEPRFGQPAMLTFQNACTLRLGDRIDVSVVCAG